MNKTKRLFQLRAIDKQMNIDKTNVSVVVSPQAFKKIVEQQIEAFDAHFQGWLNDHCIALKEFDDVLVSGGVANCNLVYEYLQKLFPNTVFVDVLNESAVFSRFVKHLQSKKQYERIGRSEWRSHSSKNHCE